MKKREVPFSPPDIDSQEIEEVIEVLKSGWITTGPQTKKFEKEIADFIGTDMAVCLNSCTAALEMTLRILGIGEGDEVIVPSYTYTATAAAVQHTGAKVQMIDTALDSFEMDYDQISSKINQNTKAIIPVDVAGKPCDYDQIFKIVEKNKKLFKPSNNLQKQFNRMIVIADGAHSFGAEYKGRKVGQVADFTCFSFHAVKNLTTGEGGAVTWPSRKNINNEELYKQYMLFSLHGQSKDALSKSKIGQWEYDILEPLYKCNMTDIQAAIGRNQLKRYKSLLNRRREIISNYNKAFESNDEIAILKHQGKEFSSSGHLFLTRIKNIDSEQRNEIIEKMGERGISCNVHYKPLPMLTAYKNLGFEIEKFPNAYHQFKNEISLPLHTRLTDEDVTYVARNFVEIINQVVK
ncbi:aminotransferase class-V family protein [Staphylococcus piscifermentans]|uniref:Capsular polysaccharide biosynthesis protein n=1 Tax=Staphylococcus piscifermentans TaxID=70258 RepID=A0A239TEJ4_9STAP|nr:DegT/DnrJ/EryC1/StrS family aminotransferase [Staphylococcus piscifermentans]RTX86700.1 DegT/DnrJ/EryC1/StrS family aminotransferase [Staphylococcus piscifermentans]GEP83661.1 capsular polysaccharide biosynthesis protein [Staphylococcus piscifermentans]SNU96120.1 aminotransferase class-V family protein [Staphylococcus piscifermentans]